MFVSNLFIGCQLKFRDWQSLLKIKCIHLQDFLIKDFFLQSFFLVSRKLFSLFIDARHFTKFSEFRLKTIL